MHEKCVVLSLICAVLSAHLSGRANSATQALCGWILETKLEGKRGRVKGKGRKVGGERGRRRRKKGKERHVGRIREEFVQLWFSLGKSLVDSFKTLAAV